MTIKRLIFCLALFCPSLAHALSWDTTAEVTILRPISKTATYAEWGINGVTDTWDAVDESAADSTISYLSTTTNNKRATWFVDRFVPLGLLYVDSLTLTINASRSGGTSSSENQSVIASGSEFLSTTSSLTTSWADYTKLFAKYPYPDSPAAWTVATINGSEFGIKHNLDVSATARVTQQYVTVYWKQLHQHDTITSQTALFDNEMIDGADSLKNYGGSTLIGVGRTTTSKNVRSLFWVDTTFWYNWGNYYIDSAFLDLKTESMRGGTHDVLAHYVVWGSTPGTANGTAQNGSSCWNYARYHTDADAYTRWDTVGADGNLDGGGLDRNGDAMDSVSVTADETVYSFRVGDWLNLIAGVNWQTDYGYIRRADSTYIVTGWAGRQTLPTALRLRQVSESLPDTVITFYAMDHATSGNRPKIRVFGTHR